MRVRRRIANRWIPTFLFWPRRAITVSPAGDEIELNWVWGKAYRRYVVFQGRYMGITYSKSDK